MPLPIPPIPPNKPLLATTTREPFQPVRLYYDIPSRAFVMQRLHGLRCIEEDREARCWRWLYEAEAEPLKFAAGYDAVPAQMRPIILGWLRFPKSGGMTLHFNSLVRAIEGARFFGPILGSRVVLRRCRVVNRCFAASEGHPDELQRELDRNVTVIDPEKAALEMEQDLVGVKTQEDLERVSAARLQRRIEQRKDVPLVEDFPLAPEEETPNFDHLAMTLQLRLIRAVEHWNGKTRTLTEIIVDLVNQGHFAEVAR